MTVLIIPASFACTDHKSTMRNSTVITLQFFFRNEMYCCIIFIKIIRHCLNLIFNACKISTFLSYYEAFSCMLLSCSQFRIFSVSDCFQCSFYRNCVLFSIFYSINSTDCIGMSLAYTLAPECIILSICKDCVCIHSVQGEHSRIPANRNDSYMIAFRCCLVNICEMFRYSGMCIKTVYHIEPLCIFRCLNRQICCTSTAENHNINFIFHLFCFIYMVNRC